MDGQDGFPQDQTQDPTAAPDAAPEPEARECAAEAAEPLPPGPPARRKGFPLWLRLATWTMGVMLALGVIHVTNYVRARRALDRAIELAATGGAGAMAQAHAAAQRAYELFPENKYVRSFWHYFAGVDALTQGKFEDAIAQLTAVEIPMDENHWEYQRLLRLARMNLAYDRKQYEAFLALAREALKDEPDSASLLLKVASGYSMLYEERGEERLKEQALDYVDKARAAAEAHPNKLRREIERGARAIERYLKPRRAPEGPRVRTRPAGEPLQIA